MEEIAENKLFEHDLEASVCAQPVRPVRMGLHGLDVEQPVRPVAKTGQTGRHPETILHSKTWATTLKPIPKCKFKNHRCHDA